MKAIGEWILCEKTTQKQVGKLFLPVDSPLTDYKVLSVGSDVTIKVSKGDSILFLPGKAQELDDIVIVNQRNVLAVL